MPLKRVHAVFYRTEGGNEPVREWLRSQEDRKAIGDDIRRVEMILLHGFVKDTPTTPSSDLALAVDRKRRHQRSS